MGGLPLFPAEAGGSDLPTSRLAGLHGIRRSYAEASQFVHSASASIAWQDHPSDDDYLKSVVGPTTSGLSVPAWLTGIVLVDAMGCWIVMNDPRNPLLPEEYARDQAEELQGDLSKLLDAIRSAETDGHALVMLALLLGSTGADTRRGASST